MLFRTRRAKVRVAVLATGIAAAVSGAVNLTIDTDHDGVPPASAAVRGTPKPRAEACGGSSTATTAAVDVAAARRIYASELHGVETQADIGHIVRSPALLSAIAASNPAAAEAAVHGLVYAPRWHIVRLRVLSAGRLLADVGGPYVIAPVTGPLRWHGRTLGSYVMSVQDDIGFIKLVSRFIGVPIDVYRNGTFLMGTLNRAPATPRPGATVTVGGSTYRESVTRTRAFPNGSLQIALFVKKPTGVTGTCTTVRSAAWGNVAAHIAARFSPLAPHYGDLVGLVRATTNGIAFVRAGSHRIAGGAGPARLPRSGSVNYKGRAWSVFSFEPSPPARVYVLTPEG